MTSRMIADPSAHELDELAERQRAMRAKAQP